MKSPCAQYCLLIALGLLLLPASALAQNRNLELGVATCLPAFDKSSDCDLDLWRVEFNWYFELSSNTDGAGSLRQQYFTPNASGATLPLQLAAKDEVRIGIGGGFERDANNSIPPPEDGGGNPISILKTGRDLTPATNFRDNHIEGINHKGLNSFLLQVIVQFPMLRNNDRWSASINPMVGGGFTTLTKGEPSAGIAGVEKDGAFPSFFFGGALSVGGFFQGDSFFLNPDTSIRLYVQNMVHYPGELQYTFTEQDVREGFSTSPLVVDVETIRKVNFFIGIETPLRFN